MADEKGKISWQKAFTKAKKSAGKAPEGLKKGVEKGLSKVPDMWEESSSQKQKSPSASTDKSKGYRLDVVRVLTLLSDEAKNDLRILVKNTQGGLAEAPNKEPEKNPRRRS